MNLVDRLLGINWREFNPFDVIKGCGEAYLADYFERGEDYKNVIKYRLKLCYSCELLTGTTCDPTKTIKHVTTGEDVKGCSCNVHCKGALKNYNCPAGKWLAVK